jgi:hypothetical protein
MTSNALILTQLLLQWATKIQEVGTLLRQAAADGRDVSDAEVDASSVKRDAALAKAQSTINQAP